MTVSDTVWVFITECIITIAPFIIDIHIDIITIATRLIITDITKKPLPTSTDADIITIAEKNPDPDITRGPITTSVFGEIIFGSRRNRTAKIEAIENKI